MIPEPINTIGLKHIAVNKDTQFEKGDIITFVFTDANAEMKDITNNNRVGMVDKVEGRYVTLAFSHTPIQNGEISLMSLDRQMVVKMNGWGKASYMGLEGVSSVDLPLADIVNITQSIIIKNMIERKP